MRARNVVQVQDQEQEENKDDPFFRCYRRELSSRGCLLLHRF